jgi:hypothetical protein
MSAPALGLIVRNTATSSGDTFVMQNFRALNKLMDAVSDVDLYESNEPKISPSAIIAAAEALEQLTPQEVDKVEVEPYSGELSLIWRAGRDRRVKAMFGPEKNSYSVYYERMFNGRVVEHRLNANADHAFLKDRLAWLEA